MLCSPPFSAPVTGVLEYELTVGLVGLSVTCVVPPATEHRERRVVRPFYTFLSLLIARDSELNKLSSPSLSIPSRCVLVVHALPRIRPHTLSSHFTLGSRSLRTPTRTHPCRWTVLCVFSLGEFPKEYVSPPHLPLSRSLFCRRLLPGDARARVSAPVRGRRGQPLVLVSQAFGCAGACRL